MTRLALAALFALATLAAWPQPAPAQGSTLDSLRLGTRVRVTAPPRARTTGTLLGRRADSLLVLGAPTEDTLRVALESVRRLDVSLGPRRRVLKGALIGYAAGVTLGGLVGWLALDGGHSPGLGMMTVGVAGGSAGIIAGLVRGNRPVERWREVHLPTVR
jgi:hypothetical protein